MHGTEGAGRRTGRDPAALGRTPGHSRKNRDAKPADLAGTTT
ncbi:hypothetical protein [Streptomyces chrestomyceticus]